MTSENAQKTPTKDQETRNQYWAQVIEKAKQDLGVNHIVIIESMGDNIGIHGNSDHHTALKIIRVVSDSIARPFFDNQAIKGQTQNPIPEPKETA